MFAKHLLQSTARKRSNPVFTPSTVGDYIDTATGIRYRVAIEGGRIRVFRRTGLPYVSQTSTNAAGQLGLVQQGGGVEIWSANNEGPVAQQAIFDSLGAGSHYVVPGLAAHVLTIVGGRRVTPYDLGAGVAGGSIDTGPNLQGFVSRGGIHFTLDTVAAAAGVNPRTILPASGGRPARCRITRMIDDEAPTPLCYRIGAGATWQPQFIAPFRRPLTVDTVGRTYAWNADQAGVANGKWVVRGGIARRPATVTTREIEISPSTGIVEIPSGRCSRHQVRIYEYVNYGALNFDGSAVAFTRFGDQLRSGTIDALQYLDGGDAPTGEFVIEASQSWPSLLTGTTLSTSGVNTPSLVTMDAHVRNTPAGDGLIVYDFDGNEVRVAAPPGGGSVAARFIQHANMIIVNRPTPTEQHRYAVTQDGGQSWSYLLLGGNDSVPPGYTNWVVEGGFIFGTGNPFDTTVLAGWQPLFVT